MTRKATYLVSVFIGAPKEQHGRMRNIASQVSNGKYEFLHLHQMGIFLVLNSQRDARQLASAFLEATAPDDRMFVSELGPDWHAHGLSKASHWLQHHLVVNTQTLPVRKDNPFTDV